MTPSRLIGCLTIAVALLAIQTNAQCISLQSASLYAIVSSSAGITTSGTSSVTGGFSTVGGQVTGWSIEMLRFVAPMTQTDYLHTSAQDSVGQQALTDATTAWNSLTSLTSFTDLTGQDLSGRTLAPGNYRFNGAATLSTGTLTLNGAGNYNFYVNGALTIGSNTNIVLSNGATYQCVKFAVSTQVTIGSSANVQGFIIAQSGITTGAGAQVTGGLFSITGTVALTTSTVTNNQAVCCSGTTPPTTTTSFAWVYGGLNTCPNSNNPSFCGQTFQTSGVFYCAQATNGVYTVNSGSSTVGCEGVVNTPVICLSLGTSGTQVACATSVSSRAPSTASSISTLNAVTFDCFTQCQQTTTTTAWVFNGFGVCSNACGQSQTVASQWTCATSTTGLSGTFTVAPGGASVCQNLGTSLPVLCLNGISAGQSVACTSSSAVYQMSSGSASLIPSNARTLTDLAIVTAQCAITPCPVVNNPWVGSWCVGAFSPCTATCGPNGYQTRLVTCTNATDGTPIAFSNCDSSIRPASQQSCNTNVECPCNIWITSQWSTCSQCRGTQTRTVRCVSTNNQTNVIPDSQCTATLARPSTSQLCNTDDTTCVNYQWVASAFGACFPSCGNGVRTRGLLCYGSVNPTSGLNPLTDPFAFLADSALCDANIPAAQKPSTTQNCNNGACAAPVYTWRQDGFGACSATCGGGVATQNVWCTSSNSIGAIVANSLCAATSPMPITVSTCNTQACPAYHIVPTAWSACSTSCGYGVQTRTNLCYTGAWTDGVTPKTVLDTLTPTAFSNCAGVPLPPTQQICPNNPACSTVYSWYAAEWSACSVSCGGGTQTRSVTCWSSDFDQREPVSEARCTNAGARPSSTATCNTQSCTQYIWSTPSFSECSCLTLTQTRTPQCYVRGANGATTGLPVADSFCSGQTDPFNPSLPCPWALAKPTTVQACTPTVACSNYYWYAGSWSQCLGSLGQAVTCGGGTMTRTVSCYQYSDDTQVASSFCTGVTPTLIASQACNTQACASFQWQFSDWCECTKQCGTGTQTRSYSCYSVPDNVAVPDSYCFGQSTAQFQTSRVCNTQACVSYRWLESGWSTCNKQCGCGRQTQSVVCVPVNNPVASAAVSDDKCQFAGLKPQTLQSCNTAPCPPVYFWAVTPYSNCTASCGGGTQTRTVNCYWSDLPDTTCQANRWLVSDLAQIAALCPTPAPRSSRPCNQQPCVTYQWYWSDWSQCSATCGGGVQTRNVQCFGSDDSRNYVADSLCAGLNKPTNTQTCNTQSCNDYIWIATPWTTCSQSCGGGTVTRSVGCYSFYDKDTQVADSFCLGTGLTGSIIGPADTPKPVTSMPCNTCACAPSYNWYYDNWGSCSVPCGGGVQTRFVGCFGSDNPNVQLSDSQCLGIASLALTKPATSVACNTQQCNAFYWSVTAWSTCDATCPNTVGSQTRTVQCQITNGTQIVNDAFCAGYSYGGNLQKPASVQSCTTQCQSCSWVYGQYSTCSKSCNGISTRPATCMCNTDSINAADPALCAGQTKASLTIPCNVGTGVNGVCNTPVYSWYVGTTGACSATCGTGTACRPVFCRADNTIVAVDDSFCGAGSGAGAKPAVFIDCNTQACITYDWFSRGYEACPVTCGGSFTNQLYGCYASNDINRFTAVSESLCNPALRPAQQVVCGTAPCVYSSTVAWYTTSYGLCSTNCGAGTQSRQVVCVDNLTSRNNVGDNICIAAGLGAKPATSQACNTLPSQVCPPSYCLSTRNDIWSCWAIDGTNRQVDATNCQISTGLTVSGGATNTWITGPWSTCSGGSQSRSVQCWTSSPVTSTGSGFSYIGTGCNSSIQPASTRTC